MNPSHIFRMTHKNNIDIFLEDGYLFAPNHTSQPQFSISYTEINHRRETMVLSNGRQLHDYVPFYFSPLTPMAYTISQGNLLLFSPDNIDLGVVDSNDIIFFVINLNSLQELNYEYRVSNSACNNFAFETFDGIEQASIDWNLFNEAPFKGVIDEDEYSGACRFFLDRDSVPYQNRRAVRGAEFLIANQVNVQDIDFIVVQNETTALEVRDKLINKGINKSVYVKPDCYY